MANIHFHSINVYQIKHSSGMFYGENFQYKWTNRSGVHEGFGRVRGNSNTIHHTFTLANVQKKKTDGEQN
ncbi:hypothetical protein [Metabacillus indicus]|uniref:hypothetical protein n=1 Tax=Metabacillus indicus TaxID=246786 RepID=UPI0004938176|nr:hypothetical protein [Metabacillus indicus]KEZ51199.1 hypothetical protein AZ46_0211430 [Metabacillus indicus LMG 22858]